MSAEIVEDRGDVWPPPPERGLLPPVLTTNLPATLLMLEPELEIAPARLAVDFRVAGGWVECEGRGYAVAGAVARLQQAVMDRSRRAFLLLSGPDPAHQYPFEAWVMECRQDQPPLGPTSSAWYWAKLEIRTAPWGPVPLVVQPL